MNKRLVHCVRLEVTSARGDSAVADFSVDAETEELPNVNLAQICSVIEALAAAVYSDE